ELQRFAAVVQQIFTRPAFQKMRREVPVLDKMLDDEISPVARVLRMKNDPQQSSGARLESSRLQKNALRFPARCFSQNQYLPRLMLHHRKRIGDAAHRHE